MAKLKTYVYPTHDYTTSWKSADGKVARWSALSTEHLVNVRNLIKSKKHSFSPIALKACVAELKRREAMLKGKKVMSTKIVTKTRHIPNFYGEPMNLKVLEVGQKIILALEGGSKNRKELQAATKSSSTAFTLALKTLIGFDIVRRTSNATYYVRF